MGGVSGPGFIVTTRGWAGSSRVYQHTAGTARYTPPDSDALNAYDVAQDLRTWLDDPARPWAAHISTVALSVTTKADGRHGFQYSYGGGGTLTFIAVTGSGSWDSRFGAEVAGVAGSAPGTVSSTPGSIMWDQWDQDQGTRCRVGSWRFANPLLVNRHPSVELAFDLDEAYYFCDAIRLASQPRTAYIWDEAAQLWRWSTLGRHELEHPDGDYTRVTGTLEVVGAP